MIYEGQDPPVHDPRFDNEVDEEDETLYSACCGDIAWGEIHDGLGICHYCREHATFHTSEELEEGEDES